MNKIFSTLLFSWPILTQIYKSEGFFSCQNSSSSSSENCSESSQDASIARIMILGKVQRSTFLVFKISRFELDLQLWVFLARLHLFLAWREIISLLAGAERFVSASWFSVMWCSLLLNREKAIGCFIFGFCSLEVEPRLWSGKDDKFYSKNLKS